MIDLQSRQVWLHVQSRATSGITHAAQLFSRNGDIYPREKDGVTYNGPNADGRRLCTILDSRRSHAAQLLPHGEELYVSRRRWCAVDLRSGDVSILVCGELPRDGHFTNIAVSALYGLVAWIPGQANYQILILPKNGS